MVDSDSTIDSRGQRRGKRPRGSERRKGLGAARAQKCVLAGMLLMFASSTSDRVSRCGSAGFHRSGPFGPAVAVWGSAMPHAAPIEGHMRFRGGGADGGQGDGDGAKLPSKDDLLQLTTQLFSGKSATNQKNLFKVVFLLWRSLIIPVYFPASSFHPSHQSFTEFHGLCTILQCVVLPSLIRAGCSCMSTAEPAWLCCACSTRLPRDPLIKPCGGQTTCLFFRLSFCYPACTFVPAHWQQAYIFKYSKQLDCTTIVCACDSTTGRGEPEGRRYDIFL